MKTNELRIGNWVYFHDGIFKIEPLTIFNISNEPQNYKPIPLTEEILLKCENADVGFSSDPQDCVASKLYKIGESYIHQPNEDDSYFIISINHEMKHVKYLHQIQNLYSILTQQELNIEL